MHVEHAYPIDTRMAESRPEEAVVASCYNFRVVTTGQEFFSVSDYPTCMVRGPAFLRYSSHISQYLRFKSCTLCPPRRRHDQTDGRLVHADRQRHKMTWP